MTMKLKSPISVFKKMHLNVLLFTFMLCANQGVILSLIMRYYFTIQLMSLLLHNTKLVPMTFDVAMSRLGSNISNLFTQYKIDDEFITSQYN